MAHAPAVPKNLARMGRRNTIKALELYAYGLAARGVATRPEVRAMRTALDWQMTRPALAVDPAAVIQSVRARHAGGQVRGEWVEHVPQPTRSESVVLYVHGGAFIAGSVRSHRGLVAEISRRTQRSVFSVDYRLAPEHRFPTAADDVLRAYSWLLSSGVAADRIVIMGDSAGGHLALGLTPRAVRAGLPAPAGVVALSPVVDVSMSLGAAWERKARRNGADTVARAARSALRLYYRGVSHEHPELMLTSDDLSVMPRVLIQASEHEILVDDSRTYIQALNSSGGTGELQLWPRKLHVFQVAHRLSAAASDAIDKIALFVNDVAAEELQQAEVSD